MSFASLVTRNNELYVQIPSEEDHLPDELHRVQAGWESFGGTYWFATEYDAETDRFFGLVQGQFEELGYWTADQLEPLIDQGRVWPIPEENLPHAGRRKEGV